MKTKIFLISIFLTVHGIKAVFGIDFSVFKKHGIDTVPYVLIQKAIYSESKSLIFVHRKNDKKVLSIIDQVKIINMKPTFSMDTDIIELKFVGSSPGFILLKTSDRAWVVNNYWDTKDNEFYYVSKKISSSKVYRSKNLKSSSKKSRMLNRLDDLSGNSNLWSKKVNLSEEELNKIGLIEKYEDKIGHSGYARKYYNKINELRRNFYSEVEFLKTDGFTNDIFLSYKLSLIPEYNNAFFAFDAGTSYRGNGAYFFLNPHLFKIETSCGVSLCSIIVEKDGEEVYTFDIKNKHYNQN